MDVVLPVMGWWAALFVLAWVGLPIAWRLFAVLPDRGIAFARPIGLLLTGYVFWLGASAGLLPNSRAGVIGAIVVGGTIAAYVGARDRRAIADWLRDRVRLVVGYECLFLAAFAGWALYRAYVPAIESAGGEKYMEMAFINAVASSPQFPPLDPWLSGFAISYYYFGYLVAGMLVHVTGIASSVAFNLVIPMTMGMTLVGAFGLGHDLVVLGGGAGRAARVVGGAFTALLLPVIGSLEGVLEIGFLRGWGPPAFYDWLGVRDLTVAGVCNDAGGSFGAGRLLEAGAVSPLAGWVPTRFIWWWRGSRVIHDRCNEVIHEFPFFSFMLGDVHPHVVALPYVLTVLALALAALCGGLSAARERRWLSLPCLAVPLLVGALGFLNTWDLPTFGFIVVIGYVLWSGGMPAPEVSPSRSDKVLAALAALGVGVAAWMLAPSALELVRGVPPAAQPATARLFLALAVVVAACGAGYAVWSRAVIGGERCRRTVDATRFAVWLAATSIVFYLPFYLGFRSQAEGIGVVTVRSELRQWLVHFGFLWFLAVSLPAALLATTCRARGERLRLLGAVIAGGAIATAIGAITGAWTPILLLASISAVLLALVAVLVTDREAVASGARSGAARAPLFALACLAVGLVLPLVTEFVFVRDLFGSRMNTVFKLYYQAWTLLAIGGGYALLAVWRRLPRFAGAVWALVATGLLTASLVYPLASVITRTNSFHADRLTLDGLAWWQESHPDDLAAAAWLRDHTPRGSVIVEADGGAYEHQGRISMASGRPAVLGWAGHEHQWRGSRAEVDPRRTDVEQIYKTTNRQTFDQLLDRYNVRYVIVSDVERARFELAAADYERYDRWLRQAFVAPSGRMIVYERG